MHAGKGEKTEEGEEIKVKGYDQVGREEHRRKMEGKGEGETKTGYQRRSGPHPSRSGES